MSEDVQSAEALSAAGSRPNDGVVEVRILANSPVTSTVAAAPIAPAAMTALSSPAVKLASFWGRAFPWGYAYYPGQCYTYVPVETPTGQVWRRVWICSDTRGPQYGNGYVGRF